MSDYSWDDLDLALEALKPLPQYRITTIQPCDHCSDGLTPIDQIERNPDFRQRCRYCQATIYEEVKDDMSDFNWGDLEALKPLPRYRLVEIPPCDHCSLTPIDQIERNPDFPQRCKYCQETIYKES